MSNTYLTRVEQESKKLQRKHSIPHQIQQAALRDGELYVALQHFIHGTYATLDLALLAVIQYKEQRSKELMNQLRIAYKPSIIKP